MRKILFAIFAAAAILTVSGSVARERYSLDEGWLFYFGSENSGDNARAVTLPHTWNITPGVTLQAAGNYDRTLYIPGQWSGRRLFLHFGGAQSAADVFVNGTWAGAHTGSYTAFTIEITDRVKFGDDNLLHVVVSNAWRSDILPASTEQNIDGGLTRSVELIVTPATAISPLHLGTCGVSIRADKVTPERADAHANVRLMTKTPVQCDLTLKVTDDTGYVVTTRTARAKVDNNRTVSIPFAVMTPQLWSPGKPSLYKIEVVLAPEGRQKDTVCVVTGFRDVKIAGGRLLVNGRASQLHGVRMMHDRYMRGAALTRSDYHDDMALIAELGADAIRSEGGPHDGCLYDRCDSLGIAAWVDLPLSQAPFLGDVAFVDSPAFRSNGLVQLEEIIEQNINHPSVWMWGIFSLLNPRGDEMLAYLRELNDAAHRLDPSRPTVACSNRNGEINFITDLIVWQQNVGWERGSFADVERWCSQLNDKWSHMANGASWGEAGNAGITSPLQARMAALRTEARQTDMHEQYAAVINDNETFWGVWLNSFADYASSRHGSGYLYTGLVTSDRSLRKDAFYLYKALWNRREPVLHIVGRRGGSRSGPQQLTVYSSAGEPVVSIDGERIAMREVSPSRYVSSEFTPRGRSVVHAEAGELRDSITIGASSPLTRP